MKNINKIISVFLVSIALFIATACSSDDSTNDGNGNNYISMKINGKQWETSVGSVMTFRDNESEGYENFFLVTLTGIRGFEQDSNLGEDEVETISISLILPESKFKNPNGTYDAGDGDLNTLLGQSIISFGKTKGNSNGNVEDTKLYVSMDPNNTNKIMGSVKVNNFKIGKQTFLGQILGEGYTDISGTFEVELIQVTGEEEASEKLIITEGKFNLNTLLGIGGLQ